MEILATASAALPGKVSVLAVISPFFLTQLVLVVVLLALFAFRQRNNDARVEAALDRILQKETEALRQRTRKNPLDFRTSENLRPGPSMIGWGLYPGKVEIVRTIGAAIDNGYRIRLRAYARGIRGRVIVRSRDVELRRTG
jgi:hypothetical protein